MWTVWAALVGKSTVAEELVVSGQDFVGVGGIHCYISMDPSEMNCQNYENAMELF
jgi:hypothetical protein